jgi:DNA-binding PadR family transcriptional regulator
MMPADQWKPSRGERRVLLALLALPGTMFGFPLGNLAQVRTARLYRTLGQLERRGWVTRQTRPASPLPRTAYRLTDLGRDEAVRVLGLTDPRNGARIAG